VTFVFIVIFESFNRIRVSLSLYTIGGRKPIRAGHYRKAIQVGTHIKRKNNMNTENYVLKERALKSLQGKWGLAIGVSLIYLLILGAFNTAPHYFGSIPTLIITGPMLFGYTLFNLAIARNQETSIDLLFKGFNRFGISLAAYLIMLLFVVLWMILLIIPGIIAALSYSMTFFIIADNQSIDAMDALKKSKDIMKGFKMKLFMLWLSFIGWAILSILTFGIGFLWLMPYAQVSLSNFYDDIKIHKVVIPNDQDTPEYI